MAERLAQRASTEAADGHAAEQIGVAQSWGIGFVSVDRASGVRTCYDGAAWRQALALSPDKPELAAAVLGLTDPGCDPEIVGATERRAHDEAAIALLERVDPVQVPGPIGNRIRIRRAVLGARLAWALARGADPGAGTVAEAAVSAFARVDKAELADDDVADFEASALAIAASRWAAVPAAPVGKGAPSLEISAGGPGETCVAVETSPKRCTHGQLWSSSFRTAPDHAAAVLAIEPLPGWLELWMFRRAAGGWTVDVLPPATEGPDLGYVELAGWSNDGRRAVIVREARSDGAIQRTFEIINLDTLAVLQHTSRLSGLGPAKAWVTPEWRGRTLALR
jgi:hypothetical protein